ncbi:Calcium homeostasis endoplasmic reticulum protein-like protein [Leptotrombidium deliense]|uniref:Calcium homeostasis endoplasmic reticulum protein-like protein n=1 Tax=Leptotrombidium deliense TaxID=299467 RepID=A0A443SC91_9ACAR|nr:Calcium homeostasis endoplasmic reticulum protein-like protein [Leptotrombidium deliense]
MSAPSNNFVPGHLMNVNAPQMPVNRGHYPPQAPQAQLSPAPQNQMFTPQISEAQEQMRQNEHNLMAQHQAMMKQQQMMMMMSPPMMIQNQPPSIQSFGPPQIPSPQISSPMPMYSQMIPPHSQSMAPSQPVVVTMAQQMQHSQHHSMMPQPGPPLVSIAGSHNQPPPPFVTQACIPPPVVSHSILPTSVPNPQFFNAAPPCGPFMINKEVPPDVAYYELPAGLMVPLVKLEDFEYNPIDPVEIKLPAPAPPNERLLKAVEAFYAPPSHDRPRNSEGWEQLGLYEFFRVKSQARKAKDDTISSDRMRITSLQNNHAESLQAI